MNVGAGINVDAGGHIAADVPWAANRPSHRPIPTFPAGRRCTCGARLSIYNEDDVCAPCSGERWAEH